MQCKPSIDVAAVGLLARFLDRHTSITREDASIIMRAIASGDAIVLPEAIDWAGEIIRTQLSIILPLAAPKAPIPVGQPTRASQAVVRSGAQTDYQRRVRKAKIIQGSAGREALAEALIASSLPAEQALAILHSSPVAAFPTLEVVSTAAGGFGPHYDAGSRSSDQLRANMRAAILKASTERYGCA